MKTRVVPLLLVGLFCAALVLAEGRIIGVQVFKKPDGDSGYVKAVAFSPDSFLLASTNSDDKNNLKPDTIKIWDVRTGKLKRTIQPPRGFSQVFGVAFSPDGKTLAIGGGHLYHGAVAVYDLHADKFLWMHFDLEKRKRGEAVAHTNMVRLAFSPDGKTLASTGDTPRDKKPAVIKLWDVATGKLQRDLEGHNGFVGPVAFSPDGKLLASGAMKDKGAKPIILWDVRSGKIKRKLHQAADDDDDRVEVETLTFARDGRTLAAASAHNKGKDWSLKVRFWRVENGKLLREVTIKGGRPLAFRFSPDSRQIAGYVGKQTVRIWDTSKGNELFQIDGCKGVFPPVVTFSANGRLLAVGGGDGSIRVVTLKESARNSGKKGVKLAPKELEAPWEALAGNDAAKAYKAVWTLEADPERSVPLLSKRLQPVPLPDQAQVDKLLAALDSDRFSEREKAMAQLEKMGAPALDRLTKALKEKPSLEKRRRLERLRDRLSSVTLSGEELRTWRALEALELIGNEPARQVLRRLAKGAPGAWQTTQARLALERLSKRVTIAP